MTPTAAKPSQVSVAQSDSGLGSGQSQLFSPMASVKTQDSAIGTLSTSLSTEDERGTAPDQSASSSHSNSAETMLQSQNSQPETDSDSRTHVNLEFSEHSQSTSFKHDSLAGSRSDSETDSDSRMQTTLDLAIVSQDLLMHSLPSGSSKSNSLTRVYKAFSPKTSSLHRKHTLTAVARSCSHSDDSAGIPDYGGSPMLSSHPSDGSDAVLQLRTDRGTPDEGIGGDPAGVSFPAQQGGYHGDGAVVPISEVS